MSRLFIYCFSVFLLFPSCRLAPAQVDERALGNIMEMGFHREATRQALLDNNNNLEAALNSLLTGSSGGRAGPLAAESHKPPPRGTHTHTHTAVALNPSTNPPLHRSIKHLVAFGCVNALKFTHDLVKQPTVVVFTCFNPVTTNCTGFSVFVPQRL